jgi:hypothetical protein
MRRSLVAEALDCPAGALGTEKGQRGQLMVGVTASLTVS